MGLWNSQQKTITFFPLLLLLLLLHLVLPLRTFSLHCQAPRFRLRLLGVLNTIPEKGTSNSKLQTDERERGGGVNLLIFFIILLHRLLFSFFKRKRGLEW